MTTATQEKAKTITYAELLAEQAARKAVETAKAQASPYETLFRAAVTMPDTGGGSTCLSLLLGMYNGERFKFNLTDLRRLDFCLHAAALAALTDEVGSAHYVDQRIAYETGWPADAIQAKLEWLAFEQGIPGRLKKDQLPEKPGVFEF